MTVQAAGPRPGSDIHAVVRTGLWSGGRRAASAWVGALLCFALAGCVRVPGGVETVAGVDLTRYQGTWYEIARLDHSFERGLSCVSARYTPQADGSIAVLNRGFDASTQAWKEIRGRALPVGGPTSGRLKVSFFGPFYGAYNIIALDPGYSYAMVCGPSRSYLWILARGRQLDEVILERLTAQAEALGFATSEVIRVRHDLAGQATPSP